MVEAASASATIVLQTLLECGESVGDAPWAKPLSKVDVAAPPQVRRPAQSPIGRARTGADVSRLLGRALMLSAK